MCRIWVQVRQPADLSGLEVLVEEQPYRARSSRDRYQNGLALQVRGVCKAGPDIVGLQVRKIGQNLVLAHATGEVLEHILDRDAQTPDTGLAAPFPRLDGDACTIVHGRKNSRVADRGQENRTAR